jgi:type IV pilus assembly protein PilA
LAQDLIRIFLFYEGPKRALKMKYRRSLTRMKCQKGFSLIELLIVVVIIGIIAAIAIPNFLASRRSANEASAISSLRTYHGGQHTYAATFGNGNYAGTASPNAFPVLASANIIDSTLGSGIKSGYQFLGGALARTGTIPATFIGAAGPTTDTGVAQTGTRIFMIGTEGVMYSDDVAGTNGLTVMVVGGGFVISGGVAVGQ